MLTLSLIDQFTASGQFDGPQVTGNLNGQFFKHLECCFGWDLLVIEQSFTIKAKQYGICLRFDTARPYASIDQGNFSKSNPQFLHQDLRYFLPLQIISQVLMCT